MTFFHNLILKWFCDLKPKTSAAAPVLTNVFFNGEVLSKEIPLVYTSPVSEDVDERYTDTTLKKPETTFATDTMPESISEEEAYIVEAKKAGYSTFVC